MAGEDCSAGFAIFPIIMIVFFLSILSRAMRGAGGFSGGYSRGYSSYRRPGMFYALQYLDNRRGGGFGGYDSSYGAGTGPPYASSNYSSYSRSQPAYYEQPPPGIAPSYGTPGYSGYQSPPPPAYQSGAPAYRQGYGGLNAPAPAYPSQPLQGYPSSAQGPAPEVPKVPCSYCSSLNPATERNCLLCGAPMK